MYAVHAVHETEGTYALDILALNYCGYPRYDQDLQKWKVQYCKDEKHKAKELAGYGDCPDDVLWPYAVKDVLATMLLYERFNHGLLDKDRFGLSGRVPFWITLRAGSTFKSSILGYTLSTIYNLTPLSSSKMSLISS
jgi:hypothetical protein